MPAYLADKTQAGVELGLTQFEAERLAHRYGTNVDIVFDIIRNGREEAEENGLSLEVYGALRYGIDHEMVATPSDFFIRRTGALYFDIAWLRRWQTAVMQYMTRHFDWSAEVAKSYEKELHERIVEATQALEDSESEPSPRVEQALVGQS